MNESQTAVRLQTQYEQLTTSYYISQI